MPDNLLLIYNDKFTPVRDTNARLLGVIPRIPENADTIILGTNGAAFELRGALQTCVCINTADPLQSPSYLDGFIPLDDSPLTLREPTNATGDDPDLAIGV